MGIVSGVALWIAAALACGRFSRSLPIRSAAFIAILDVTALVLPIASWALIAEGVLKGFEQYGWLRLTEVGGNVLYVAAVYALVWQGAPFEWIAYSYLAMTVAKYLVLAACGRPHRIRCLFGFMSWTAVQPAGCLHRCWLMFNNRIAGTFQQTLVPLAIGASFRPYRGRDLRSDHPVASLLENDHGAASFRNSSDLYPYR